MNKYLLLFGFIFIANLVFADCYIEGSAYFINLETAKAKEFLGLTNEEISDSEKYKEVVSVLKDKYAIDIEKDIKTVSLFVFPRGKISDHALVISGNFDTEDMQKRIKNTIESGKWRFHEIETIEIGGNKYSAFRIDEFLNFIYFDKNTIVISSDFILKPEKNIKLSNIPDLISKIKPTTNNYLYGDKALISRLKQVFKLPDMGLEKANSIFCYIKDNKLFFEANFNDSETSKDVMSQINNLSKEQIEIFRQKFNDYLERINKEIADSKDKYTPNTFELIFHSVFFNKSVDMISNLNFEQKDNSLIISCDFDWNFISSVITAYNYKLIENVKKEKSNSHTSAINMEIKNTFPKEINSLMKQKKAFIYIDNKSFFKVLEQLISIVPGLYRLLVKTFADISKNIKMNIMYFRPNEINYFIGITEDNSLKIGIKCSNLDLAKELMEYFKKFKQLYSNYLQKNKDIYSKENLANSTFADFTILSTVLYSRLKAKKFIDSTEISLLEDENIVFLKTKFDNAYIIRSIASNLYSTLMETDNTEEYVDFTTLKDKLDTSRCLLTQTFISSAADMYNSDHEDNMMTTLDISVLVKNKYLRPDEFRIKNCEYYTEGDLTNGGYIACKIHGSNKRTLFYSNKKNRR